MIKIGIVTLYYKSTNYGGNLQAYALEKYLNNKGYNALQICFDNSQKFRTKNKPIKYVQRYGLIKLSRRISDHFIAALKQTKNKCCSFVFGANKNLKIRKQAFKDFREKTILHTEKIFTTENIFDCTDFDVYICGSDQVWRGITEYTPYAGLNVCYWLNFVSKEAKKISYAASVGLKEIPLGAYEKIKQALSSFDAISVREESTKAELNTILGGIKPVYCVLDPTFLLPREHWDSISGANPYNKEKYVFAYLLGDKKKDRVCITKFAKQTGLKIITIPYLLNKYRGCDRAFGDIQISDVSPNLWISLIRDAQYVFTDSFHAGVFSLLFHKQFYIFKRFRDNDKGSMNSRIQTLTSTFQVEDTVISNDLTPEEILSIDRINYDRFEKILAGKRKESEEFLISAIEGKNEE